MIYFRGNQPPAARLIYRMLYNVRGETLIQIPTSPLLSADQAQSELETVAALCEQRGRPSLTPKMPFIAKTLDIKQKKWYNIA